MPSLVHAFAAAPDGSSGGSAPSLLGGKGAALASMTRAGLPVPPGFTFTTEAFHHFRSHGWDERLDGALRTAMADLEAQMGRRLGDEHAPLLVSVRSGAPVSMPGMLDTVLDVGMTPEVETGLGRMTGDTDFAADTARRAAASFATVTGVDRPGDPLEQVRLAIGSVFGSWDGHRAATYRRVEGIPEDLGTAATVQAMVFGNLGPDSGTGVAFSRDPSTGARRLVGDFLPGAQGEDVVAGDHPTLPLDEMARRWPEQHARLTDLAERLERQTGDMVDLEFTVERGTLWLLQVRRGKRSALAALRIAVDMVEDPDFPLDRAGAVARCRPWLDDPPTAHLVAGDQATIARGLAASPGRASGVLCLDPDDAVELGAAGHAVVLARTVTSPADVHGMAAAAGLFTTRGGLVSHAALVARDWGLPAVVGAEEATVEAGGVRGPGGFVAIGSAVTVDGDRGLLLAGVPEGVGDPVPEALVLRSWADELDATL